MEKGCVVLRLVFLQYHIYFQARLFKNFFPCFLCIAFFPNFLSFKFYLFIIDKFAIGMMYTLLYKIYRNYADRVHVRQSSKPQLILQTSHILPFITIDFMCHIYILIKFKNTV